MHYHAREARSATTSTNTKTQITTHTEVVDVISAQDVITPQYQQLFAAKAMFWMSFTAPLNFVCWTVLWPTWRFRRVRVFCLSSHWVCVFWGCPVSPQPSGDHCPVLPSQLQDGPVVHVTSVSANGRAKPVSSTAPNLSVSLATNSLGPQLS